MAKVCFVQKILKDTDFKNGKEKVDFYILKALVDLGFKVDVFCIKNRLTQNYKIKAKNSININQNFAKLSTQLSLLEIENCINFNCLMDNQNLFTVVEIKPTTYKVYEKTDSECKGFMDGRTNQFLNKKEFKKEILKNIFYSLLLHVNI